MPHKIQVHYQLKKSLADTVTPVGMYLRLREHFPGSLLLESADYHGSDSSFSYICCNPLTSFKVDTEAAEIQYPDGAKVRIPIASSHQVVQELSSYLGSFESGNEERSCYEKLGLINGIFGYVTYDSVQYFEDIKLAQKTAPSENIPRMHYAAFEFILVINHFKDELYILQNQFSPGPKSKLGIDDILLQATRGELPACQKFSASPQEQSNMTDSEQLKMIEDCKRHIYRGDVFQIVPSRKFSREFRGDDFSVYRALRSINPSPYLFYFDYGDFHIFGSSPEAQIVVKNRQASIFPIAGTYRRSGDAITDAALVEQLKSDPKENAEHVMLVDLARNDLSKHCDTVRVETYREVQLYSHVIHLVSKVVGTLKSGESAIAVLADTFPAGTLSGAPKYKAMELIDRYERGARGFYGGAIGFLGFNGDCNHAITIRSFLSKNGRLHLQAGGGLVADSQPELEVQEVKNKLGALNQALTCAAEV